MNIEPPQKDLYSFSGRLSLVTMTVCFPLLVQCSMCVRVCTFNLYHDSHIGSLI